MKRPRRADDRLLTAVLYRGAGNRVLQALRRAGINTAVMCRARGSSVGDPASEIFEKEVVTVLVPAARASRILSLISDAVKEDRPDSAFVYLAKVARRTAYALPDVGDEKPD